MLSKNTHYKKFHPSTNKILTSNSQQQKNYNYHQFQHFTFNKDNFPYSHPLDKINFTQNIQSANQQAKECNSYRVSNRQTHYLDSVVVDYKQKTFQLMRKNAQLQLSIKQYRTDIAHLQSQVSQLTQLTKQIFQLISNGQLQENCTQNQHLQNQSIIHQQSSQKDNLPNSQLSKQSHIKQIMQKINKNRQNSTNSKQNTTEIPTALNSTLKQHKLNTLLPNRGPNLDTNKKKINNYTQLLPNNMNSFHNNNNNNINNNFNNNTNPDTNQNIKHQQQLTCNCEQNYNNIIIEYKTIIQTLHSKIIKRQKNTITLKQQLDHSKKLIQQYCKKIQSYQLLQSNHQQIISQLTNKLNNFSNVKTQIQSYGELLQKKQQQCQNINKKYQQLLKQSQQKDQSLQWLVNQNNQIFKQKQNIKQKYQQQFTHFQQMSKIIQQKLIEVQYQMNFYKKQRNQNLSKIIKLQNQLKQYKFNQQKKYYSFGDNQQNTQITTNNFYHQPQLPNNNINKLSNQNTQKNQQQTTYFTNDKCKFLTHGQPIQQIPQQQSPKSQKKQKQKQNWQVQCYQQSIKTLLQQNNRLKNSLLKLYNYQKQQGNLSVISKQIQLQIKILISTMPIQSQQIHHDNCDTVKKI